MRRNPVELHAADGQRRVESALRADREWLQADRIIQAADQRVRRYAGADGRRGAGAAIAARERAGTGPRRRIHPPADRAAGCVAEINAKAPETADVALGVALRGIEHAVEAFLRADD